MAWIKVPPEHHPIFLAALPRDPRVSTLQMFGGIAIKVRGNMAGGLFGRSAIVRLPPTEREAALALDGAAPFDPMGTGRVSSDMVMLPEDVMGEPAELRAWLEKAIAFTATMPAKAKAKAKAKAAKRQSKPEQKPKPTPKQKPKPKPKPAKRR